MGFFLLDSKGYLKSLGVAASVSQLAGGIHSYLEAYSTEARDAGLRTVGELPGSDGGGGVGGVVNSNSTTSADEGSPAAVDSTAAAVSVPNLNPNPSPNATDTESRQPKSTKKCGRGEDEMALTQEAECLWEGVNYTFDNRSASPSTGSNGRVGRCCYCGCDWHTLSDDVVCAVCCDEILVCEACREVCKASKAGAGAGAGCGADAGSGAADCAAASVVSGDTGIPLSTTAAPTARASLPTPSSPAKRPSTGGVNFQARLRAEQTSVFLCTEHHLLSDNWRAYLDAAAQHASKRSAGMCCGIAQGAFLPTTTPAASPNPEPSAAGANSVDAADGVAREGDAPSSSNDTSMPDLKTLLASLQNVVLQLRAQLNASKAKSQSGRGRGKARQGRDRRRRIELQVGRIEVWLQERSPRPPTTGATPASLSVPGGDEAAGVPGTATPVSHPLNQTPAQIQTQATLSPAAPAPAAPAWSAFFPLLGLWDN